MQLFDSKKIIAQVQDLEHHQVSQKMRQMMQNLPQMVRHLGKGMGRGK